MRKNLKTFILAFVILLNCTAFANAANDMQKQLFDSDNTSSVRDIRTANLGEDYNNSIFENLPSESPLSAQSLAVAGPSVGMYYSKEAQRVALEAERAIDNKIITRLALAIENYHSHLVPLTSRRIEFLRETLRVDSAPDVNSVQLNESKLFVILPNLVREFPDKLYDFAEAVGPDCRVAILVGTDFEKMQMEELLKGLPTSVVMMPVHFDSVSSLISNGFNVKEALLVGLPKDDSFADRILHQFQESQILTQKKILPPNSPFFDLVGRSAQFAIILRVAWYAAVSS